MQYSNYIFNIPTRCKYITKRMYYVFHCIVHFVGIIKDIYIITVRKMHRMERFKIIYAVLAGVTELLVSLCVFNVKQIADILQ